MAPDEVKRKKLEGLVHLRFVAQLYKDQIRADRDFLHEHALAAMSWAEECKYVRSPAFLLWMKVSVTNACMGA